MGLNPELVQEPQPAPPEPEALAFGKAWAGRVLGSGGLTDDERVAVALAVRRCHGHAGLVRPSAVCWVASPEAQAAFLAGDRTVVRGRTEIVTAGGGAPGLLPWASARRAARRAARVIGWVLSPVLGALLGVLVVGLAFFFWIGLVAWLVIAGSVAVLRVALVRVARRLPPPSLASGAAVLAVLAVWGVGFTVAVRAVARPDLALGVPDEVANGAFLVGAVVGALVPATVGWRRRRRSSPADLPNRPAPATLLVDEMLRRAAGAAGTVPLDVRGDLSGLMAELDPLCRTAAGRPSQSLVLWAWAEHQVVGDGPWDPVRRWWRAAHDRRRRAALRDFEVAARVSWRPAGREAVAVEPPLEVHGGPEGLHRLDGPAVVWADGSVWYAAHGVRLPRRPDCADWTVDEIHEVTNTETRRMMIESIGWDAYLAQGDFALLGEAPDPGNAPHRLRLYELPREVYERVNLLVMTNGSPSRDGRQRRYAEFVPRGFSDPVDAAAWQYGVPAEVYRQLERRT